MKIKDLIALLQTYDPEGDVLVRLDGRILPTDNADEHSDYNDLAEKDFYVLAKAE